MARKGNHRRTPHEKKHALVCEWCGREFYASKDYARTDSGICRQRLATFFKRFGWYPDAPPGQVTLSEAVAGEIEYLIVCERLRREDDARSKETVLEKTIRGARTQKS